jgi:hypothetical protein
MDFIAILLTKEGMMRAKGAIWDSKTRITLAFLRHLSSKFMPNTIARVYD